MNARVEFLEREEGEIGNGRSTKEKFDSNIRTSGHSWLELNKLRRRRLGIEVATNWIDKMSRDTPFCSVSSVSCLLHCYLLLQRSINLNSEFTLSKPLAGKIHSFLEFLLVSTFGELFLGQNSESGTRTRRRWATCNSHSELWLQSGTTLCRIWNMPIF
jgi:hypothetical protein